MTTIVEIMCLLTLIGGLAIFVLKIFNIVNIMVRKEQGYDKIWIFLTMGGYMILWLFSLQIVLNDPAQNPAVGGIYLLSFQLLTVFLMLTSMLMIFEVILSFTVIGDQLRGVSPYRERGVSLRRLP